MTAGRSAGTEQGQGREVCRCGHPRLNHWQSGRRECMACKLGGCADFTPSPSVPPARDSGLSERSVTSTEDRGQDEAERDPHWLKDHFELDGDDEPLHEVECPSCGVTIRARMADAPDPGGRDEAREAVARALRSKVAFFWGVSVGIDHQKLPEFWDEVATVAIDALPPAVAALLRDGTTT